MDVNLLILFISHRLLKWSKCNGINQSIPFLNYHKQGSKNEGKRPLTKNIIIWYSQSDHHTIYIEVKQFA